ncbi:MAG TPA: hypothetical protein VIU64_02405, partial [Polyangia bacterium]
MTSRRALTVAVLASGVVSCRGLAHRQPGDESISVPLDGSTTTPPARPPSAAQGPSKGPASPPPRFDAGVP